MFAVDVENNIFSDQLIFVSLYVILVLLCCILSCPMPPISFMTFLSL